MMQMFFLISTICGSNYDSKNDRVYSSTYEFFHAFHLDHNVMLVPSNFSFSPLFLSIPPSPYFYQFLLFLIFINSSISLFLSIPPSPYFYQFLLPLIFINSFSSPNFSFVFYYEKQISICFERKIVDGTNVLFDLNDLWKKLRFEK